MKRFLIFMLLSPLLAFITYMVVVWFSGGRGVEHVWQYGPLLIMAYIFSLPATVSTCLVDQAAVSLAPTWLRIIATAAVGFCVVIVGLKIFDPADEAPTQLGLVGAIPALICSWLSGNGEHRVMADRDNP